MALSVDDLIRLQLLADAQQQQQRASGNDELLAGLAGAGLGLGVGYVLGENGIVISTGGNRPGRPPSLPPGGGSPWQRPAGGGAASGVYKIGLLLAYTAPGGNLGADWDIVGETNVSAQEGSPAGRVLYLVYPPASVDPEGARQTPRRLWTYNPASDATVFVQFRTVALNWRWSPLGQYMPTSTAPIGGNTPAGTPLMATGAVLPAKTAVGAGPLDDGSEIRWY